METRAPFPIIAIEGEPYERGHQYGTQAKDTIAAQVKRYRKIFQDTGLRITWDEIVAIAKKFESHIAEYDTEAVEEMRGMAEGAGVSFEDVLIINTRTEIQAMAISGIEDAEGSCTVIVATPEATENHHMLMAQNMDHSPGRQYAIVKTGKKGGPNTVGFQEVGMLIKNGFNSAGIVCLGNGIWTDAQIHFGVPAQILVGGVLSAENFGEAVQKCLPARRGKPCNKVIGSAEGLCVDVELEPDWEDFLWPEDGLLVHTNHWVVRKPKTRDLGPMRVPSTLTRRYRALQLLLSERGHITVETFKRVLTDHLDKPDSICMHVNPRNPVMQYQTALSFIIDVTAGTAEVAKGPPCKHGYVHLDFSDMLGQ